MSTLSLPDICGKVAFPNLRNKLGERYVKWFDKYAKPLFTGITTSLPSNKEVTITMLDGNECWALRCALFHAGNYRTKDIRLKDIRIHAHKRNGENYSHIVRDSIKADFDVIRVCNTICDAAEAYHNSSSNKNLFEQDEVRILTW